MSNCACGNRLSLGTEVSSGVCLNCQRGQGHLRTLVNTARPVAGLVVSQGGVTPEVVSQELRQVVSRGVTKGEQETKEQRWRRTHADQRRLIHRDGQRRRRA